MSNLHSGFRGARRLFLAMLLCAQAACSSAHGVLILQDAHDDDHRARNAASAAAIAGDSGVNPALRLHAWTVVGRLRVFSPEVYGALKAVLLDNSQSEPVRRHAILALGEVGRETPWEEGGSALHELALKTMAKSLTRGSALQLLEAVAKIYPQHGHTPKEQRDTFLALNGLQAKQKKELPGLYYTVLKQVADLDTLGDALEQTLAETRKGANEETWARAYGAALTLLRIIEENEKAILASFQARRERIAGGFAALTKGFEVGERRLALMVAWSLGRLATDPKLGRLVAQSLADLLPAADPALAFLVAWSLTEMDQVTPAREALREKVLKASVDENVHRMILAARGAEEADVIQSLHGLNPEAAP